MKLNILKTFSIALRNRYYVLEDEGLVVAKEEEIESDFQVMEKGYTEVAERVQGRLRKRKELWIKSQNLVDQRKRVKRQLRAKYTEKEREVKRSIKAQKRKRNIADEPEEAAKSQHIKKLYGRTKMLCNERSKQSTTVLDKNGNLVSSKSEVKARSTEQQHQQTQ